MGENPKMVLKRIGREGVAWIHLAQDKGTSINLLPLFQCKRKDAKGTNCFV
jgi:hypothetical protein